MKKQFAQILTGTLITGLLAGASVLANEGGDSANDEAGASAGKNGCSGKDSCGGKEMKGDKKDAKKKVKKKSKDACGGKDGCGEMKEDK